MHKSLEKFRPYVDKGLLRQVISPCGRLVLWNYTDLCTYERAWDDVTLNARGTVYEMETGKVIARSFNKFFNFSELPTEKQKEVLQSRSFETFEKMDGSLGIVYYYDGEWRVNTRGSFTSDQAVKGKELLNNGQYNVNELNESFTYLVEIIYPENRIIVDYGDEHTLSLLAIYDEDGYEVDGMEIDLTYNFAGLLQAPSYNFTSIQELQDHLETLDHTEEGYVVRLASGERVKFKSAEYLKVARMMQNMTPLAFWKGMKNGEVDRELLEQLPEEFREESDKLAEQLESKYYDIQKDLLMSFTREDFKNKERKDIALISREKDLNLSAMFAILDEKYDVLDSIIMKQIRPFGNNMEV